MTGFLAFIFALIFAAIGLSGIGAFILFWTAAFIGAAIIAAIALLIIGFFGLFWGASPA